MMENNITYERYARQLILKGFGEQAQSYLRKAHVVVIGAGGLGCPVLNYLVAAGVGELTIVDDDTVSIHNLHRQVLFDETNVGELKVEVAKRKLSLLNTEVILHAVPKKITQQLAIELFPIATVIVDATDNFAARYIINDGCVLMKKPFVFGAVSMYEGQIAVFNRSLGVDGFSCNYRSLFPQPPTDDTVLSCAEAGVIGVLPGIIGSMQAMEVIKLITGIGKPLVNTLLTYDSLSQTIFTIEIVDAQNADTAPKNIQEYLAYDYVSACASNDMSSYEIEAAVMEQHITDLLIVDVRELFEEPRLNKLISNAYLEIPLSKLEKDMARCKDQDLVFVCQSGKRSKKAVEMMLQKGHTKKIFSLRNGIQGLSKFLQ